MTRTQRKKRQRELKIWLVLVILTIIWGYAQYVAIPQARAIAEAKIMLQSYNENHTSKEAKQISGQ